MLFVTSQDPLSLLGPVPSPSVTILNFSSCFEDTFSMLNPPDPSDPPCLSESRAGISAAIGKILAANGSCSTAWLPLIYISLGAAVFCVALVVVLAVISIRLCARNRSLEALRTSLLENEDA
jgi:hypothetical protein